MSFSLVDQDVILNRINIALEKSRRVFESWLPPTTNQDEALKTATEREQEEAEILKPEPDLLGLGAVPIEEPQDGNYRGQGLVSNEQLRNQLLGKHGQKHDMKTKSKEHRALPTTMGRRLQTLTKFEQNEEPEEGRSGVGRKRKDRDSYQVSSENSDYLKNLVSGKGGGKETEEAGNIKLSTRTSNYLDEVLQAKARKKSRKRNKTSKSYT